MIFARVRELIIPEGTVRSVFTGDKVLWKQKQAYTNLIPSATATPDGSGIYNGTGYKDDYRWSNSSKTESAYTDARLTGWIPFVSGATYRIKNFYISRPSGYASGGYLIFCADDGTISSKIIGRTNENYDAATDTLIWREENPTRKYFRISAYKCEEAPIVTMNEEIPL